MRPPLAAAVAGLSMLLAQVAAGQQTYTSMAGPWWFTLSGRDAGSVVLELTSPIGGRFLVADVTLTDHPSFGFSRSLGAFFQIAAGQTLALDARGNLSGSLALSDPNDPSGEPIGTLTIDRGKPSKAFTKLGLNGTIANGDGTTVVPLKLTGVRPPSSFPVLTGRTTAGSLKGKGVKSQALDLSVLPDELLGLPAYAFSAQGPVEIDKVQEPDAFLDGHIVLTPDFKAQGLLEDSSDFGTGPVAGKLGRHNRGFVFPKLSLDAQSDRRLKLVGTLIEAVEPILRVTPTSFDFGAVALDGAKSTSFSVQNVGVGALSGEATFLDPLDPSFQLTGETTYTDLAAGDAPVTIGVTFTPLEDGAHHVSLRFGVTGAAGAVVVPLTGTGGIAALSVSPERIDFGSRAVGSTVTQEVTVSNTGDGTLKGAATLTNLTGTATVFSLLDADGRSQTSIAYEVAAGGQTKFRVQFRPVRTGTVTGTLSLTGAAAVTSVDVSGTGV